MKKIVIGLLLFMVAVTAFSHITGSSEWMTGKSLEMQYGDTAEHFYAFKVNFLAKSGEAKFTKFLDVFLDKNQFNSFTKRLLDAPGFEEFLKGSKHNSFKVPLELKWNDKKITMQLGTVRYAMVVTEAGADGGGNPPYPNWRDWSSIPWVIVYNNDIPDRTDKTEYKLSYDYVYSTVKEKELGEYINLYNDLLIYEIISLLNCNNKAVAVKDCDKEYYPALTMLFLLSDIYDIQLDLTLSAR